MAGPGQAPKPQRTRPNENAARQREMTHLHADDQQRGPDLPDDVLPAGEDWHPATVRWWDTWRLSPQAQQFTDTDWRFLLDTALMHHTMWSKGRWEYAGELRLRSAKFGATPEDRMRLKQTVHTEADAPEDATSNEQQNTAAGRRKDLRIVG